ncbi:MAG: DUF2066 domain-containing protein [Rhizobiaceae bacterium]
MVRGVLVLLLLVAAVQAGTADERIDELYRATVVVTGQGEENRIPGFRLCLEDVLVKLSGDPRLIGDAQAAKLGKDAPAMVEAFAYRDLLEGIPIHDEQGTYDRPHYLTTTFRKDAVDTALAKLGRKPWLDPRPTIALVLTVENPTARFVLSSDADRGLDMRASLDAASKRVALPVVLPAQAAIEAVGVPRDLDAAATVAGAAGGILLAGSLTWSDEALGWIAEWRLVQGGRDSVWQASGISFDDAFRHALRGAAQLLSGNGTPQ